MTSSTLSLLGGRVGHAEGVFLVCLDDIDRVFTPVDSAVMDLILASLFFFVRVL